MEITESEESAADKHYKRGIKLYNLRRYDEAEQELKQGLLQDPCHFGCLYVLILVYLFLDPEKAIWYAERLLEYYPDDYTSHYQMGQANYYNGRNKEALRNCREALILDPHVPEIHVLIARICHAGGRRKKTLDALEQALQLDPQHLEALLLKAELLDEYTETRKEALLLSETILKAYPENAEVHAFAAKVKSREYKTAKESLRHYEISLRLNPLDNKIRKEYQKLVTSHKLGLAGLHHLFGVEADQNDSRMLGLCYMISFIPMVYIFILMKEADLPETLLFNLTLFILIAALFFFILPYTLMYFYLKYIRKKPVTTNPFSKPAYSAIRAPVVRISFRDFFTINQGHNSKMLLAIIAINVLYLAACYLIIKNRFFMYKLVPATPIGIIFSISLW